MASLEAHPLHPGEGVPLFIAAGVLKLATQLEQFIRSENPSIEPVLTLGSFTLPAWLGNASAEHPTDFVYYHDLGMAGNARGLPGGGIEGMRALKIPIRQLADGGKKTILSVTNLPHEKPIDVIPRLVEAAAELEPTAIEVNLSCPNGKKKDGSFHPPLCNDADASGDVMQESRRIVGPDVCLGSKDSPHTASLDDEVNAPEVSSLIIALNPLVNFFTGINTIGNQPFPEITSTGGRGGMSGPIVAKIARSWLTIARKNAAEHVAILSCGGVDSKNVKSEAPLRQQLGALLVGGAQDFYRAEEPAALAAVWADALSAPYSD